MRNIFGFLMAAGFTLWGAAVSAHEFWIDSKAFQVENGGKVLADLRNGQQFSGVYFPYFKERAERFAYVAADGAHDIEGRDGDRPAFQLPAVEGLMVLVYQSAPSDLTYAEWDVFRGFIEHKGFADVATRHEARGLSRDAVTESYRRYCKALVGVGAAKGADSATGMETEFVAKTNPYTDDLTKGMQIELLYQGKPRADAQYEVYERDAAREVTVHKMHTDAAGRGQFAVKPGHSYMVDAVVMREPDSALAAEGIMWQSLWASMTFAVPE